MLILCSILTILYWSAAAIVAAPGIGFKDKVTIGKAFMVGILGFLVIFKELELDPVFAACQMLALAVLMLNDRKWVEY